MGRAGVLSSLGIIYLRPCRSCIAVSPCSSLPGDEGLAIVATKMHAEHRIGEHVNTVVVYILRALELRDFVKEAVQPGGGFRHKDAARLRLDDGRQGACELALAGRRHLVDG